MNDTIDPTLSVVLKHLPHSLLIRQIDVIRVNLRRILVLLRGVFRQRITCDLLQPGDGLGEGVVVVVDGDDLVASCFLKAKDDVGA